MNYMADTASDKFKSDFPNEYHFMASVTKNVDLNNDTFVPKRAVFAVNVLYKYLKQNEEFKKVVCRIYPKLLAVMLEKQLNTTDYGKHSEKTHIENCDSLSRIMELVMSYGTYNVIDVYIDNIIKRTI